MSIISNRSVIETPTDRLIRVQEQVLTELRKRPPGTTGSESAGLRAAAVDQRFVDLTGQVQELVRLQKEAVLDRNLDEQRRQERERQRSPDSVADCVRTLTAKVDDMARVQAQMLDEQQQHGRVAVSALDNGLAQLARFEELVRLQQDFSEERAQHDARLTQLEAQLRATTDQTTKIVDLLTSIDRRMADLANSDQLHRSPGGAETCTMS